MGRIVLILAGLVGTSGAEASTPRPAAANPPALGTFQNQTLVSGLELPTAVKFLPNATMLVLELGGRVLKVNTQTWAVDPTPFLQLDNVGTLTAQQGLMDMVLDPAFSSNRYYYVFYTRGTPNRDRVSRFTATAGLSGTVPGSEFLIYEDPQTANAEHHGGALNFGADGKLYVTTGEHFGSGAAQDLASPRGKLLRFNPDGTVPTDNPFYDGGGPNYDAIWALGLRNPFRAFFDGVSGRLYIADVGSNDNGTSLEEVHVAARGANYGWPDCEGAVCIPALPNHTPPLYVYPHNGRDASITGGFVYRGSQFPAEYLGNYFFADYAQNWIKRLTLDALGRVTGVLNFEPADGAADGPWGDIVHLCEGPDGALYYVDIGDLSSSEGTVRRIRFLVSETAPVVVASATPTEGLAPLRVTFSSVGTYDADADPLTYLWTFGDGGSSTLANPPPRTYASNGPYTVQLTVSDGIVSTQAPPITISVGIKPVATITAPADGNLFRGGASIPFSGEGTDAEDGTLPASAFKWSIDFLHEGHAHPGTSLAGAKSGTFAIPTSGHDFQGNTRYRFTLEVVDSDGLKAQRAAMIYPDKNVITFDSVPRGMVLKVDGLPRVTPFAHDTLIDFQHEISAPDLAQPAYPFVSWSDGGNQTHVVVVPANPQSYLARYDTRTFLNTLPPCRLLDTRASSGPEAGAPALVAGESRVLAVAGKCLIPPTAKAISANVTVTGPTASGFLTLHPADQAAPATSNINFRPGETRANNAILPIAIAGSGIRIVNASTGTVNVIVDVNGWFQ